MPSKYTAGKKAIAECDRCGFRYKLKELKKLVIKTKTVSIKVCPSCWEPDQPQLSLGLYPVNDPQAVRDPRPDKSYWQSGFTGLQTDIQAGPLVTEDGYPSGGSRIIQWGWNPVGGARFFDTALTPNYLVLNVEIGTVTVTTT